MKNKFSKWISLVFVICILLTLVPLNALNTNDISSEEDLIQANDNSSIVPLEDPQEDQWNFSISWYDNLAEEGQKEFTEYSWDAVDEDDIRSIVMQINYANNNVVTSYNKGELKIKIPYFMEAYQGYYFNPSEVTAGSVDDGWDWDYYLEKDFEIPEGIFPEGFDINDESTYPEWNVMTEEQYMILLQWEAAPCNIVLVNNTPISKGQQFKASLQVAYQLDPAYLYKEYETSTSVTLENTEGIIATSNEIKFNFTSNEATYTLTKTPTKIKSYDGLPENAADYIWVKWDIKISYKDGVRRFQDTKGGLIQPLLPQRAYDERSLYFVEHIEDENILVFDAQYNPLTIENGTVKITNFANHEQYDNTRGAYVYVGYPKETYKEAKVSNTVDAYGIYWDNTEASQLGTYTTTISSADYDFIYEPGISGFYKTKGDEISAFRARKSFAVGDWGIGMYIYYNFKASDLVFTDDILIAPDADNNYVKLTDDEYYFTNVYWNNSSVKNLNGDAIAAYDMQLYLRYANTDEFVLYTKEGSIYNSETGEYEPAIIDTFKANQYQSFYFGPEDKVVGIRLVIKDVNGSIITVNENRPPLSCYIAITKKDLGYEGKVYNFASFQQVQDGQVVNIPKDESYNTDMTVRDIFPYDNTQGDPSLDVYTQRYYGHNVVRDVGEADIIDNYVGYQVIERIYYENSSYYPTSGNMTNFPIENKFIGGYLYEPRFSNQYGGTDNGKGYVLYNLLPEGMKYEGIAFYPQNGFLSNRCVTQSGQKLNNDYLKEHTEITITENWNNTNRTLIVMKLDFSDDPINIFGISEASAFSPYAYQEILFTTAVKVSVSYDSYVEYGNNYPNIVYMDVLDRDNLDYDMYLASGNFKNNLLNNYTSDNNSVGLDSLDFNNNGKNEPMFRSTATLKISDVSASYEDVMAFVKTDYSNYNAEMGDSSLNAEYNYKLRVRNGVNRVKDLIIYNNLETATKKEHWNGTFLGVDTSYAESKGYKVEVYYSTSSTAGTLDSDNTWALLTETTDKSSVKSLAFKYLNADGTTAIIPENDFNYVIIRMLAPNEEHKTLANNRCWLTWTPIDEFGLEIENGNNTLKSNIVRVALPTSIKSQYLPYVNLHITKDFTVTFEDVQKAYDEGRITTATYNEIKSLIDAGKTDEALTVAFEHLQLNPNDTHNFKILLTNKDTKATIQGELNNKSELVISQLQPGDYLITEGDDVFFDFVNFEVTKEADGISFTKTDKGYLLSIKIKVNQLEEDVSFKIKTTNKTETSRSYEDKDEKTNMFKYFPIG